MQLALAYYRNLLGEHSAIFHKIVHFSYFHVAELSSLLYELNPIDVSTEFYNFCTVDIHCFPHEAVIQIQVLGYTGLPDWKRKKIIN